MSEKSPLTPALFPQARLGELASLRIRTRKRVRMGEGVCGRCASVPSPYRIRWRMRSL